MTLERAQGTRETVPCETPNLTRGPCPKATPLVTLTPWRLKQHPATRRGHTVLRIAETERIRTPIQQKFPSGTRLAGQGLFRHFWNNVICVSGRLRIAETRRMHTPMQQKSPSGTRLAGWGLFRHFWNNVICVSGRPCIDYCRRMGFFVSHPRAAVEGEKIRRLLGRQGSGAQTEAGPTLW